MTAIVRKKMHIGLALTMTAAVLGTPGCHSSSANDDPRSETKLVEIAKATPALPAERSYTGVVKARVQSNLTFRVPGKIVARMVDDGQDVRQGQPLMRIDPTDLEHAVELQTGNLAAARARLIQAAADEERYRHLVSTGAVSRSAFDRAKAAADSAQALVVAATAGLKEAQDENRYSILVADADGTVMGTVAEPGQFVAAGQVVLELAHAGPREAAIDLPETVRPAIGSIARARIYGDSTVVQAHLRQLSDNADPFTRTFEARYVLNGPSARAPLGATVTVYLSSSAPSADLSVPLGAIDDEGKGPGVWIYDGSGSSVSFRRVHVVRLAAETAIVNSGLSAGEPVVALGGHFLYPGEHVRVVQYQADLR